MVLPARFEAEGAVNVRREPRPDARRHGILLDRGIVTVSGWAEGRECEAGWGQIEGGWICLDHAHPTSLPLAKQHALIPFDNPEPQELAAYRESGQWDRDTGPAPEALLPFVYGRRAGRFEGRCYADVEARGRGESPAGRLDPTRKYHFEEVVETEEGSWLRLAGGRVIALDDVLLYAPSRFGGFDPREVAGPPGALPAWVRRSGGGLHVEPSSRSAQVGHLEARQVVWLSDESKGWFAVEGREGRLGWIAGGAVRRWRPLPSPAGVDAPWVDVDLGQQVLALRDGEELVWITLVSTGVPPGDATPEGLYRIYDKMLHWDMASGPGSPDPYHLEEVPWVMHFRHRYALHGAFWHDGFGQPRSHGCVNLSPRDARELFERTSPAVPPGWHTAFESPDRPGTLLRIRSDSSEVPDQRKPLR